MVLVMAANFAPSSVLNFHIFFLPQNGAAMDTNVHIDQVDMDQLRSALPI